MDSVPGTGEIATLNTCAVVKPFCANERLIEWHRTVWSPPQPGRRLVITLRRSGARPLNDMTEHASEALGRKKPARFVAASLFLWLGVVLLGVALWLTWLAGGASL
jgi:hypothetical protein